MAELRLLVALMACFAAWVIAAVTSAPRAPERCVEIYYTNESGDFVCDCCDRKEAAKETELELQKEREAYEIRGDER